MTQQKHVMRVLLDKRTKGFKSLDSAFLETVEGDVYFFHCRKAPKKGNHYNVSIYQTMLCVDNDSIERVADIKAPVWRTQFFAATQQLKMEMLFGMLLAVMHDDLSTCNLLFQNFGGELHGDKNTWPQFCRPDGQVGLC